ncbi:MAG TPA: hypothetical protein VK611_24865 [Acidimicrobiales bacterium]|nr:hypothetical protein [Acidimicrobiales bacterium]
MSAVDREQVRALVERMTPPGLPDQVRHLVVNTWVVEWMTLLGESPTYEVARVGPVTSANGRRVMFVLTEYEVAQEPNPAGGATTETTGE